MSKKKRCLNIADIEMFSDESDKEKFNEENSDKENCDEENSD